MAAAERPSVNTAAGAADMMRQVSTKIEPPEPLSERQRIHFDAIVISREISTWSPHDIRLAVTLAIAQERIEHIDDMLKCEGLIITGPRGTPIAHPLLAAQSNVAGQIRMLSAALGLSASQRGITGEKQVNRNQAELAAREVIDRVSEGDGLLA